MNLDIHGIKIQLRTNSILFHNYIKDNFSLFVKERIKPDIRIEFEYVPFNRPQKSMQINGYDQLSADLFMNKDSIYTRIRGLEILYEKKKIKAVYHEEPVNKLKLMRPHYYRKYIKNLNNTRNQNVHFSARYAFHLPIIHQLEQQGCVLLHGSAVEKDNKAMIFSGLNRCGKSTLSSFFIKQGYNHISDNFVLIKKNRLLPFPESQRIDKRSAALLNLKNKENAYFGKFHLKSKARLSSPILKNILLLKFGQKTALKKIKKDQALRYLKSMHDYLKEFPGYSYLAFSAINKKDRHDSIRLLRDLCKKTDIYTLTQEKNSLEKTENLLKPLFRR